MITIIFALIDFFDKPIKDVKPMKTIKRQRKVYESDQVSRDY